MIRCIVRLRERKIDRETQYHDAGNFIKHSFVIIFLIDTMSVYLFAALSDAAFSRFSLTQINACYDVVGDYFRKVPAMRLHSRADLHRTRESHSRDYKAT